MNHQNQSHKNDIQDKTSGRWQERANCKGKTNLMFPQHHKDITYIIEARKICSGCGVKEECLNYALEFHPIDMHGVWAGMTSRQLSAEQKRRGIKPVRPSISQMWEAL
jgi:WhiB family redox-sensing transcriptional regulator